MIMKSAPTRKEVNVIHRLAKQGWKAPKISKHIRVHIPAVKAHMKGIKADKVEAPALKDPGPKVGAAKPGMPKVED